MHLIFKTNNNKNKSIFNFQFFQKNQLKETPFQR